ncbi:hypothetical protein DFP72DRAFT_902219 [Ephemerocybe angulata]|uniref:Uncharacterized protein n=1 Tax=Ephemerocybe angulata TaxID=980116 RepID=A0A8H6HVM2_9AGAR|nr:hypothetical protein DFP72DRAFT_902219 [Tulosesus angulatus]
MSYYYDDNYGDYGSGGDSYGGGYEGGDQGGYSYDQGSYTSAPSDQGDYGFDSGQTQGEYDDYAMQAASAQDLDFGGGHPDNEAYYDQQAGAGIDVHGYDTDEYDREPQAAAEYHDAGTAGPFSDWQEDTNDVSTYTNEAEVDHDSEWDPMQTSESFQRNCGAVHFPSPRSVFAAPQAQWQYPSRDTSESDNAHYFPDPVPALPTRWQDYHPMYWPEGLAESLGVSLSVAFSPFLVIADPPASAAPSPPLEDGNIQSSNASPTFQTEPEMLEPPGAAVELEDFLSSPAHDHGHPDDHQPSDIVLTPPPVPSPAIDDCPPPSLSTPTPLRTDSAWGEHSEKRPPQHEHPPPTLFSMFTSRQRQPYRIPNSLKSDWYSRRPNHRTRPRPRPPRHPPNIQARVRTMQPPPHHNSRRPKGRIRTHRKRELTPPDPPKPSSQDPRVNALRRIAWKASRTHSPYTQ